MKQFKFAILFLFLLAGSFSIIVQAQTQTKNKYGLDVIDDLSSYKKTIELDGANELINLEDLIPDLKLDIKYATADNFLEEKVYDTAMTFLRLPAALSLMQVQNDLANEGLALKIFDAYRPYSATVKFYESYKDTTFVASAWRGSRHNRGCAVDLTLINKKTGDELIMPTPFDDFTNKAFVDYDSLSTEAIANRSKLISIMERHGFQVYKYEWWHFDFKGWDKYELLDLSFSELIKLKQ